MALDDCAHHRKAETAAAGVAASRRIQAEEWVEHPLTEILRDSGAAVVDQHLCPPVHVFQGRARLPAVTHGIVKHVLEQTPQRHRPTRQAQLVGTVEGHRACGVGEIGDESAQKGREIDRHRALVRGLVPWPVPLHRPPSALE